MWPASRSGRLPRKSRYMMHDSDQRSAAGWDHIMTHMFVLCSRFRDRHRYHTLFAPNNAKTSICSRSQSSRAARIATPGAWKQTCHRRAGARVQSSHPLYPRWTVVNRGDLQVALGLQTWVVDHTSTGVVRWPLQSFYRHGLRLSLLERCHRPLQTTWWRPSRWSIAAGLGWREVKRWRGNGGSEA